VISFDADGTLVDNRFTDCVWFRGIPKLYARRWGVPFDRALKIVKSEYKRVGPNRLEWYDLKYWFKKFSLGRGWSKLLDCYSNKARAYPEVKRLVKELSKEYELVVASASSHEFLDITIKNSGLTPYFSHVFSSISDFGTIGKQPEFFNRVCKSLKVNPAQLLHVGDNRTQDYVVPRGLGIKAVLLDRSGEKSGRWVIHDLKEVEKFLEVVRSRPI
jgi:putative hydrolase of the HAD superfamily